MKLLIIVVLFLNSFLVWGEECNVQQVFESEKKLIDEKLRGQDVDLLNVSAFNIILYLPLRYKISIEKNHNKQAILRGRLILDEGERYLGCSFRKPIEGVATYGELMDCELCIAELVTSDIVYKVRSVNINSVQLDIYELNNAFGKVTAAVMYDSKNYIQIIDDNPNIPFLLEKMLSNQRGVRPGKVDNSSG